MLELTFLITELSFHCFKSHVLRNRVIFPWFKKSLAQKGIYLSQISLIYVYLFRLPSQVSFKSFVFSAMVIHPPPPHIHHPISSPHMFNYDLDDRRLSWTHWYVCMHLAHLGEKSNFGKSESVLFEEDISIGRNECRRRQSGEHWDVCSHTG